MRIATQWETKVKRLQNRVFGENTDPCAEHAAENRKLGEKLRQFSISISNSLFFLKQNLQ